MTKELMWRTVLVEPGRFIREQVPVPVPAPGEVLVRVTHVGVCGSDLAALHGKHPYIQCPIVLGHECSGVIAGGDDKTLPVGTRVAVNPTLPCFACDACQHERYNMCATRRCIGAQADGAHAEYVVVPAGMALPIPDSMSLRDAALIEPMAVAYHGLKRVGDLSGRRVMVVGAGPIGISAVQSAQVLGAQSVWVADLDPRRLQLACNLGAQGTIDVSKESLGDGMARMNAGAAPADVLVDCVGGKGAVLDQLVLKAPRGADVLVVGVLAYGYDMPNLPDFVEHELTLYGTTMYVNQDYREVIDHIAAGRLRTDGLVTHTYSLDNIAEAFAEIEAGRDFFFKVVLEAS
jgi:L-iditol 2-dehydrogenase